MTATKPSETTRGQAWLGNFLVEDRPIAELLVDSLEFVRTSTMRPALRTRLEQLAESGEIEQPAVLAAAMSMEDLKLTDRPVAYTKGFETLAVPIDATPGSEGFVGNLIRDLLRTGDGWLPPSAVLDELRGKRCRSIVVVTDWAGSGTQLRHYALTLTRHPTVRSWRSGGFRRVPSSITWTAVWRLQPLLSRTTPPRPIGAGTPRWRPAATRSERACPRCIY
jgi:hypothetical protein